jgi:uncharacterized membrane protein
MVSLPELPYRTPTIIVIIIIIIIIAITIAFYNVIPHDVNSIYC